MTIPKEVIIIIEKLGGAGFEAYIVGGCVRDVLRGVEPEDWDVATNAIPKEIQNVFPDSFYENKFLTVTAKTASKDPMLAEVEITTYRLEAGYSDKRHPDEVRFAKSLQEDLMRRDFTVNAMAMGLDKKIIDPFSGQKDLKKKIIRAVGNPEERFREDALRMLRAVRLAAMLSFSVEKETEKAIRENSLWIDTVSKERVRDELLKIIMSDLAAEGIKMLRQFNLLKFILPELEENYGVGQNKHHIYDCYTHALKALEYSAKKKFGMHARIASLLHDIAKPRVKAGEGPGSTFYNHEVVGAKMTFDILSRLKFPKKDVEKIVTLVRYHLFYYNVGEVSESSVRRLVRNVGKDNMEELLQVRQADRIGSGVPKAEPYKLRHLKYIIEKVSQDPISVKMLKVNGKNVMNALGIAPGPKVGQILDILLGHVLDDPIKNNKEFLTAQIKHVGALDDKTLEAMAEKARENRHGVEMKQDEMAKSKYWVT